MSNILLKYTKMEVEQYSFKHPTSFIVSGATQSGKSTFVKNLLANKKQFNMSSTKSNIHDLQNLATNIFRNVRNGNGY